MLCVKGGASWPVAGSPPRSPGVPGAAGPGSRALHRPHHHRRCSRCYAPRELTRQLGDDDGPVAGARPHRSPRAPMVVTTVLQHPNPAGPPPALSPTAGPLRTFGVEEELLLVDAETLDPLAVS